MAGDGTAGITTSSTTSPSACLCALERTACRSLQAEHLKADLAIVEARVPARCTQRVHQIQSIVEHFKRLPEYRGRIESYPLFSLATLVLLAMLCGAPCGQKDLEKFAAGLSSAQRRASGATAKATIRLPASRPSGVFSAGSALRLPI